MISALTLVAGIVSASLHINIRLVARHLRKQARQIQALQVKHEHEIVHIDGQSEDLNLLELDDEWPAWEWAVPSDHELW